MKNFLITVLAAGLVFISFAANGQGVINSVDGGTVGKSPKFIEGIEIKAPVLQTGVQEFATPEPTILPVQTAGTGVAIPLIESVRSFSFKYAQLMDVDVEQVTNLSLFKFIDEWWGTRYRYGGTGKSGIDCSAFTGQLFQQVYNQAMPRTARAQYQMCSPVSRREMKEGDLLFFNTRGGVSHVGVYLGHGRFVHSSTSSGVTISKLDDDYYTHRFIGAGRFQSNGGPVDDQDALCID